MKLAIFILTGLIISCLILGLTQTFDEILFVFVVFIGVFSILFVLYIVIYGWFNENTAGIDMGKMFGIKISKKAKENIDKTIMVFCLAGLPLISFMIPLIEAPFVNIECNKTLSSCTITKNFFFKNIEYFSENSTIAIKKRTSTRWLKIRGVALAPNTYMLIVNNNKYDYDIGYSEQQDLKRFNKICNDIDVYKNNDSITIFKHTNIPLYWLYYFLAMGIFLFVFLLHYIRVYKFKKSVPDMPELVLIIFYFIFLTPCFFYIVYPIMTYVINCVEHFL